MEDFKEHAQRFVNPLCDKMKKLFFLKFISASLSEVAMAFYLILIFSFYGNLGSMSITENILIGSVFMVVIPASAVLIFYRKIVLELGLIERQKRPKLYLVNVISYAIASLVFNYFNNSIMLKISLSFLLTMLILFLINFRWKVSLHAAGVVIASIALFLNFGLISLIFFALIPFIYWLRFKLKAHNIYQLLAGSSVAFVITYAIFLSI